MTKHIPVKFDAELEEFLKALSNLNRRKILFLFMDGRERTVNEIAQVLRLGQSTASEHLKMLKRASLMVSRKEGKEVFYKPDRGSIVTTLRRLSDLLMNCC